MVEPSVYSKFTVNYRHPKIKKLYGLINFNMYCFMLFY